MSPAPLFMFGLPRSGTNLLTRVLNLHPKVMVAVHAFQPLFKSLRAASARAALDKIPRSVDLDGPVHDGHFSEDQRRVLDAVHEATLELSFCPAEWPKLHRSLTSRASDDAADLCNGIANLKGAKSYRDLVDRALQLIVDVRGAGECAWVGMVETWAVDLLPALARAYPDARFVAIERDPRAIASSMLGYLPVDPGQVGHILSVIRHWRKEGAVLQAFSYLPELDNRLFRVRYEDLAGAPANIVPQLCSFLGIDYRPSMLAMSEAVDIPTGQVWEGNSTFDRRLDRISDVPVDRWRKTLSLEAKTMIEFAAGEDMKLRNYEPDELDRGKDDALALAFLIEDHQRPSSWRCDLENPLLDFGWEAARRALIQANPDAVDRESTRRCFLYERYYRTLNSYATG